MQEKGVSKNIDDIIILIVEHRQKISV